MATQAFDPTIPAEDKQEFFDRTCEHLALQKRRAVDSSYLCLYRAPGGLSCAIGAHIPDGMPGLRREENEPVNMAVQRHPSWLKYIPCVRLASRLQIAHDKWRGAPQGLIEDLKRVADEFNLDPAAVEYIEEWEGRRA